VIATKVMSTARGATRPETYRGSNRVPAAITLWLILVLIAVARNKGLPDQRHAIALGVGAIVIAFAAAVAPRVVFYALLATVLVVAATNSELIARYIDAGTAQLKGSLGGGK
jgi:hypothetical protein